MTAVGIDLGTTYSAVAWVPPGGVPVVIPDDSGEPLVPSVVSFRGPHPVVGLDAKADYAQGEPDTAAFFKSSMGDPAFSLHLGEQEWDATGLSSLVLAHLKDMAGRATGKPVTQAVITVPEYFTHPQRAATIEAGNAAGLDVLRVISEPTSAALAYGLRPGADVGRLVVYDLGGGTFDVSVVELTADAVNVIAAAGDHELGGRDWDDRIASELADRFLAETGADLLAEDTGGLLVSAERLKRALSSRRSAEIRVGDSTRSARYTLTRTEFEAASADLLARTSYLTQEALVDAGLTWAEIDGVLPVGGSTRMPMVRDWIVRMSGRDPMGGIHPDHAVALGAAAQAELLAAYEPGRETQFFLPGRRHVQDVVAHSLGMIAESSDQSRYLNSVLLKRNSAIPCRKVRPYHFDVAPDNPELEVFLTQAETDDPAECTYLGRYVVTGFPTAIAGTAVVDIAYAYDENAVVTVSATERFTGTALDVRVDELPADVPGRFLSPPRDSGTGTRGPTTVYLAFDLSGSMAGQPLAEARRAAKAFVSQVDLTTTAVGLIAVSDQVHTELTASQNTTTIERAIDGLRLGSTGYGNAGHPFDEIHRLMAERPGHRFALVLADGVWADQPLAVDRARRCHASQIDIIAIGFGSADRKFLNQIASATENSFFTSVTELTSTFGTIARELTEGSGTAGRGLRYTSGTR